MPYEINSEVLKISKYNIKVGLLFNPLKFSLNGTLPPLEAVSNGNKSLSQRHDMANHVSETVVENR
jgi:hypothetical protein